ncbi:DUF4044 domain-containing protein [Clostridium sp. JN-9]|nr:DUF4044 domain-containing protein [Clostridium sp. JN-9]
MKKKKRDKITRMLVYFMIIMFVISLLPMLFR